MASTPPPVAPWGPPLTGSPRPERQKGPRGGRYPGQTVIVVSPAGAAGGRVVGIQGHGVAFASIAALLALLEMLARCFKGRQSGQKEGKCAILGHFVSLDALPDISDR
jgi:hypothetical protein